MGSVVAKLIYSALLGIVLLGSSILGTGDVALILDVAVLVRQAVARGQVRERLALSA